MLTAGVHFADTREADFSACEPADHLADSTNVTVEERHTKPDPLWQLWLLILLAALLVSWKFTKSKAVPQPV
ncbi:hypothetical protein D3C87_1993940 [compost metagenome]